VLWIIGVLWIMDHGLCDADGTIWIFICFYLSDVGARQAVPHFIQKKNNIENSVTP